MKLLKTIIGIAALMAVVSCTKSQRDGNCQVVFEVISNTEVADVTKSSVSEYTALPSADEFAIVVTNASGTEVWSGLISKWNPDTELPAGNYTVQASYGSIEEEGFDKPYFYGTKSFKVAEGESVTVSVPVALSNTIIRFSCSENFKKYYRDYTFKLTRDGNVVAAFAKNDTRAAFIDGYRIRVEGVLTKESGVNEFSKEYTDLNEGTVYTMFFDVPNVAGSAITISFDNTTETVELGKIELND